MSTLKSGISSKIGAVKANDIGFLMDLKFTPEEQRFREEVRSWFQVAYPERTRKKMILGRRPTKQDMVDWQRILNQKGWGTPAWPIEHGGTGWDTTRIYIFKEEMQRAFAQLDSLVLNINLVGPLIIAFGSDEQRKEFLPKVRNMDIWCCQGFSEPGAGSDLASLRTSAVRDGDHYVVNGSKIWTSTAQYADFIFALVRTDISSKKQEGITCLLIDMKAPGVTVRPILTMDGHRWFNQEFFDDVRVPVKNRVGEENKGWRNAKYLLGHERVNFGKVGSSTALIALTKKHAASVTSEGKPLADTRQFRESLAELEIELKALEITSLRVVAEMKNSESAHRQDPKASLLKIKGAELYQLATEIFMKVAGPHSVARQSNFLTNEAETTLGPEWAATSASNYFVMRSRTIAGGSSEVQRNIIAKSILHL